MVGANLRFLLKKIFSSMIDPIVTSLKAMRKELLIFLLIIWPSHVWWSGRTKLIGSYLFATIFYPASWLHAWRNADASKSGVAQETIQNTIRRGSKVMTEQEARQILGVTEETSWEEIMKVGVFFACSFICI